MTFISNLFHSIIHFFGSAFQFPISRTFCFPSSDTGKRFPNLSVKPKFLSAFAKLRIVTMRFVTSVYPSAWNNSVPTEWIFVKFESLVFFENVSRKLKFH